MQSKIYCITFISGMLRMKIVWDERKRVKNSEKHDLDFRDLDEDFFSDALILEAKERRLRPSVS